MRIVKLLVFAAFAMFAFGAVGTAVAMAEEDGPPEILCLTPKCIKELEGHFETHEGSKSTFETLGGQSITATRALLLIKNCEPLPKTEEKDTNLCKDQELHFDGFEEPAKKAKCKSEAANGMDKDLNGEVLLLVDLHLAAELNEAKTQLEPLLLMKVLGPLLENEVLVKCGVLNIKWRGTLACLLLPGLTIIPAGDTIEILCKLNKTTHDPETGECELLCEWLKEFPFEVTNVKGVFEMAWMDFHLLGTFNRDIFIDD